MWVCMIYTWALVQGSLLESQLPAALHPHPASPPCCWESLPLSSQGWQSMSPSVLPGFEPWTRVMQVLVGTRANTPQRREENIYNIITSLSSMTRGGKHRGQQSQECRKVGPYLISSGAGGEPKMDILGAVSQLLHVVHLDSVQI